MVRRGEPVRGTLSRRSDAGVRFEHLHNLLRSWGVVERRRASHHLFRKDGLPERINSDASAVRQGPIRCVRFVGRC